MYFNIIVIKFVENFRYSNLSKILSNDTVCPAPLIDPDKSRTEKIFTNMRLWTYAKVFFLVLDKMN